MAIQELNGLDAFVNDGGGGTAGSSVPNIVDIQSYQTIIEKQGEGIVQIINSNDTPFSKLSFTFPIEVIPQTIDEPTARVLIKADVYKFGIINYTTSDGQSGTISGDTELIVVLSDPNYIEFTGVKGEQYSFNASIKNQLVNTTSRNTDFKVTLPSGDTTIDMVVTKNNVQPAPNSPTINVSGNSFVWNINEPTPLQISYTSTNSDYVMFSLGKVEKQLPVNGTIDLSKIDFVNGIGNYSLYLQPVSNRGGSGPFESISINVLEKSYLPGPDITNIYYPETIIGKDFAGFDVPFDISWSSVNTNYVNIYVSKVDSQYGLGRFSPSGLATFNVGQVLNKAKAQYTEDTDKIEFKLYLVPTNIEGDEITDGKVEEISILFDKGDLKLQRGNVVSDIRFAFESNLDTTPFKDEISNLLTHYAHFGSGDNKLIATWGIDTETFSEYIEGFDETGASFRKKTNNPKSLVLKLYEPLPTSVQPNQAIWISKIQSIPIIEQITIVGDLMKNCAPLTPNFDLDLGDDVGYQILDDLLASGSTTSTELVNQFISSSEFSLDNLDIQFVTQSTELSGSDDTGYLIVKSGEPTYAWENFVKYSSAEERIHNFYYKVKLIEFYNTKYRTLTTGTDWTGSLAVVNEANKIQTQISNVTKGFDSFEKWLFVSSSENELTLPKENHTGSFLNPTGSEVLGWYESVVDIAQEYDYYNKSNLVNNLPEHIQNDDEGQDFVLFFNMVGQHFDILWTHIKGAQQSKKLEHKFENGIKDDLIYHMLESLGWDADMGVKSQFLWEYAFGKHSDGTQVSTMSGKDRQNEIWRRLLNNLPYLNKHKGTKRALHAAMACYGIPSSLLTVMEFGGPQDVESSGTTQITFDDRTAAINLSGSANIRVPWKEYSETNDFPNSVELRINTTQKENQLLAEVSDSWRLEIERGSNYLGRVKFTISGSGTEQSVYTDYVPVFYDDFYHITVNKDTATINNVLNDVFTIYVKEGFAGRIRNSGSIQFELETGTNSWKSGSELVIGNGFTGSIDEVRLWSTPLDESRIVNHTLMPDAIDGNHISASTEDLLFRLDFEYPKNRGVDTEIKNVALNYTYGELFATASNFESITDYPYNYTPYERSVTANVPSSGFNSGNKFRFENQYDLYGKKLNELSSDGDGFIGIQLDYKTRSTKKSFDTSPIDSDRLGLFFSPIKEINMDILKSLGQFDIDNYIGDPSDEYRDEYKSLSTLRNYYFDRYDLNFNEYIQLVRYIDKTLFSTLESLVPARAKVSSGLLIEPHILERSKVAWKKPSASEDTLETVINVEETTNVSTEVVNKETVIDAGSDIVFDVSNPQYDGTITSVIDTTLTGTTSLNQSTIDTTQTTKQFGFMTVNSGSDMGGISITVDAMFTGSLTGEYDSSQFTQVGMDPDSISVKGFNLWAENGNSQITELDVFGNIIKTRKKVFRIKESYQIDVPENINQFDESLGREFVKKTFFRYKITTLDWNAPTPQVIGNIVEVTPINGYLPSHYRNVGDLTTGLENSYFNGSKQTQLTTLDGGSPVVTFTTNPNTLRVSDTGRGSGEPILEVD
jgi:hypothetical protein